LSVNQLAKSLGGWDLRYAETAPSPSQRAAHEVFRERVRTRRHRTFGFLSACHIS
jgi:hypothetical protein